MRDRTETAQLLRWGATDVRLTHVPTDRVQDPLPRIANVHRGRTHGPDLAAYSVLVLNPVTVTLRFD